MGIKPRVSFKSVEIPLDRLLLDPNNYRFLDNPNYKKKIKTKYHVGTVQEATLRLLEQDKRYQLSELKKSILANGYVPMERIIIIPYQPKADFYLVVEGNRRVAALKSLLREHAEGVIDLSDSDARSFQKIPCAILDTPEKNLGHAERVIMGIRHIAGPREWGAYQQAQLVLELHDDENNDFQQIGEHLGISTVEVARRYRAMKALKTMEGDEQYASNAAPDFYRLFHELVSLPDVRKRFGWSDEENRFTDQERAREFYELIAPTDGEAKLRTYSDVRKLRYMVGRPKAEAALLDPDKQFSDALRIANAEIEEERREESSLRDVLKDMLAHLKRVEVDDLRTLKEADARTIGAIVELLKDFAARIR